MLRPLARNEKSGVDAKEVTKQGQHHDDITGLATDALESCSVPIAPSVSALSQNALPGIVPSAPLAWHSNACTSDALQRSSNTLLVTLSGPDIFRGRALPHQ